MNLISKKDLLAITGISYGQLYRWKRERLIPEEWFIKQSAYTGQETFFPRDQMLSRIKSIQDLKDRYSLEELAKILSPETSASMINCKELAEVEELDKEILSKMPEIFCKDSFEFCDVALSVTISKAARIIGLTEEQSIDLLKRSITAATNQKAATVYCTVFFTGVEYHTVFTPSAVHLSFDGRIDVKVQLSLSEITDTIKTKYKKLFL